MIMLRVNLEGISPMYFAEGPVRIVNQKKRKKVIALATVSVVGLVVRAIAAVAALAVLLDCAKCAYAIRRSQTSG